MKFAVDVDPSLSSLTQRGFEVEERAVTRAMRRAARDIKAEWRGQITGAGLGRRLSNTVRSASYPKNTDSMNAAAMVWTNAPRIISAHNDGATVRSPEGFWLAIPLPAAGRLARSKRMTPLVFEQRTGLRLRFVYLGGRRAFLVADDARLSKRGLARRKGGRRRKDGILTGAQTVPVFLLVPQVRLRKRLNLYDGANAVAARVPGMIVGGAE